MTRAFLFLLALIPGVVNYLWISPGLWSHNSSSAFDLWLFMWGISIGLPLVVLMLPSGDKTRHE